MTDMIKLRIEVKGYIPEKLKRNSELTEDEKKIIANGYRYGKTHANTDYLKQSVNIYHDTDSVSDMKLKLPSPYGEMLNGGKL